jgi:hypothetical protein
MNPSTVIFGKATEAIKAFIKKDLTTKRLQTMTKDVRSIYQGQYFRLDMQGMTKIGRHNCQLQINDAYLRTSDWKDSSERKDAGDGTTVAMVHIQEGYGRDAEGNLKNEAADHIREELENSFKSRDWTKPIYLPALTKDEEKKMNQK